MLTRIFLPTIAALLLALVLAVPAQAAKRVALVIGNAVYAHAPRLANPLNDAGDIGAALGRLGYEVTKLENADQIALRRGLQSFARTATGAEAAVVFYAGHGIEVDKRNFLVPVDARLSSDREVEFETVPLDLVARAVEGASGLGLVILDACRDNPFAAAMQRAGPTRSIGRGLARVEPAGEMLIAYAARGGTVASDGAGRNSPYTEALLAHLEEPGLEVGLMFRKVRDAVLKSTGNKQEPFVYGSLSSEGAYLSKRPEPNPPSAPQAKPTQAKPTVPPKGGTPDRLNTERVAAEAYKAAERLNTVDAYTIVIERFPDSVYAALARGHIRKLNSKAKESPPAPQSPKPQAVAPKLPSSPEALEAALKLKRTDRRLIQLGLASLGFRPGPADGLFGPATRSALRAWQTAKGQEATGWLTQAGASVLAALGRGARPDPAGQGPGKPEATVPEPEPHATPNREFRDCDTCPLMVVVSTGSFVMGSPAHEEGRNDDEGPQRRVAIRRPFAVGKFEVTFDEWDACVSAEVCQDFTKTAPHEIGQSVSTKDEGWGRGSLPAVNMSWDDVRAYLGWLSRNTGKRYRLLSEAEWEYVARAGTRGPYHFGPTVSTVQANYRENRTQVSRLGRSAQRKTTYVGSFPPKRFGLHDLHGNVSEWVEDCWHADYRGAPVDGSAWTQGGNCGRRVLRGGSWNDPPEKIRSASRTGLNVGHKGVNTVGFRVARTIIP